MTPPTTISSISSAVAVIDADEFDRAVASPETRAFWVEVDAYEREIQAAGLDHVPARIELP